MDGESLFWLIVIIFVVRYFIKKEPKKKTDPRDSLVPPFAKHPCHFSMGANFDIGSYISKMFDMTEYIAWHNACCDATLVFTCHRLDDVYWSFYGGLDLDGWRIPSTATFGEEFTFTKDRICFETKVKPSYKDGIWEMEYFMPINLKSVSTGSVLNGFSTALQVKIEDTNKSVSAGYSIISYQFNVKYVP